MTGHRCIFTASEKNAGHFFSPIISKSPQDEKNDKLEVEITKQKPLSTSLDLALFVSHLRWLLSTLSLSLSLSPSNTHSLSFFHFQ
jgi:hypothetical protein